MRSSFDVLGEEDQLHLAPAVVHISRGMQVPECCVSDQDASQGDTLLGEVQPGKDKAAVKMMLLCKRMWFGVEWMGGLGFGLFFFSLE